MNKKQFSELSTAVKILGRHLRGKSRPGDITRTRSYPADHPAVVRARLGLSQAEFARLLGTGLGTLRHWEQGTRQPTGAARVLLRVAARDPEAILRAVA